MNRFKNHINIDGKNHVAYVDATLVFINIRIENNTLYFNMQSWNTEHAQR